MMYIYKNIFDMPLIRKLYLCLVVFLIFPLLIIAFIINDKVSQVMNKNIRETNIQVLKQTKPGIERVINDCEYMSLVLLSDEQLQQFIKFYDKNSFQDIERKQISYGISIQPILDSKDYISSICISRGENVIFQYGNRVNKEDTSFHEQASSLTGRVLWTPSYMLKYMAGGGGSKVVISLIRAVNDLRDIKQIATERISIDENYICNSYKDVRA